MFHCPFTSNILRAKLLTSLQNFLLPVCLTLEVLWETYLYFWAFFSRKHQSKYIYVAFLYLLHLPHPSLVVRNTDPGEHLNWLERCLSDDFSTVMLIPSTLIANFPVVTACFNRCMTASLVSSMATFRLKWLLLIETKNRISMASFTLRHLCVLMTRTWHSSAKVHPGTLLNDVQTSRWIKMGSRCKFWLFWHRILGNFRVNRCLIWLGEMSAVTWVRKPSQEAG